MNINKNAIGQKLAEEDIRHSNKEPELNRKQRRKEKVRDKAIPKWVEECVPVTVEQFELACKVAHAASTGLMPRQSFSSKFQEARERGEIGKGEYLVLGDKPINHAAMAILDCYPDKSQKGSKLRQSLLWRTIFVAGEVYRDARARAYIKKKDNDEFIGSPLVEAVATFPMNMGEEVPVDAIFARAAELAVNWDPESEPCP